MKPDKVFETVEVDRGKKIIHRWYYYFCTIVPSMAIIENKTYRIADTNGMNIQGFVVKTINDKIDIINVFGYHPNSTPISNCFHISKRLQYKPFNKGNLKKIIKNIQTYNLTENFNFNPIHRIKIGARIK